MNSLPEARQLSRPGRCRRGGAAQDSTSRATNCRPCSGAVADAGPAPRDRGDLLRVLREVSGTRQLAKPDLIRFLDDAGYEVCFRAAALRSHPRRRRDPHARARYARVTAYRLRPSVGGHCRRCPDLFAAPRRSASLPSSRRPCNISVVICSHNPRTDYLDRAALAASQTVSAELWGLIVIDNACATPLAPGGLDLGWHGRARDRTGRHARPHACAAPRHSRSAAGCWCSSTTTMYWTPTTWKSPTA